MSSYKDMHTRQLLAELGHVRAKLSSAHNQANDDRILAEFLTVTVIREAEAQMAEIKAELATREHIPSKAEAKAIRQMRAKNKCR